MMISVIYCFSIQAQNQTQLIERQQLRNLATWGGANVISGAGIWLSSTKENKAFYGMNAAWGAINLAIAGVSYRQLNKAPNTDELKHNIKLQKILLINTGLDVLYIGAGAWMLNQGRQQENLQWIGGGQSIIIQGLFLAGFDLYYFSRYRRQYQALSITPTSVVYKF